MTIHNEIKTLRLNRNITQEQLAQAVKVSRQTIVAIEKGNYTPSLMLAFRLARYFKLPLEKVFDLP